MVVILGIAIGIGRFGEVTSSVLEPASQLAGWFAIFMGGYLNHDVLELLKPTARRDGSSPNWHGASWPCLPRSLPL